MTGYSTVRKKSSVMTTLPPIQIYNRIGTSRGYFLSRIVTGPGEGTELEFHFCRCGLIPVYDTHNAGLHHQS